MSEPNDPDEDDYEPPLPPSYNIEPTEFREIPTLDAGAGSTPAPESEIPDEEGLEPTVGLDRADTFMPTKGMDGEDPSSGSLGSSPSYPAPTEAPQPDTVSDDVLSDPLRAAPRPGTPTTRSH